VSQLNPEAEWFGFTKIKSEEKAAMVGRVFTSVAVNYDLMNDLMSCGLHRLWKNAFVARMRIRSGMDILDIAGGTGDIALRMHKTASKGKRPIKGKDKTRITVCDINPEMMKYGRAKALNKGIVDGIDWIAGDAEKLPFPSRRFDLCSIAFGLRNVTRIDDALKEAARILRPGGKFFCLEFSSGVTPILKPVYETYCKSAMPLLGEFIADDKDAYQYLAESIIRFPPQKELAERMKTAGFDRVKWTNLAGGIAVIHEGTVL